MDKLFFKIVLCIKYGNFKYVSIICICIDVKFLGIMYILFFNILFKIS